MRKLTAWMFFTAAIGLLCACAGAREPVTDGELSAHTIRVGERNRSYLLYTPASAAQHAGTRPLVLVFHGGGGTAKGIAREVGRSLHRIADRDGIFVVYPHAVDKMWDLGGGTISESLDERIDDRRFFGELVDEMARTLPIDDRRVFATGISRGAPGIVLRGLRITGPHSCHRPGCDADAELPAP